MDSGSKALEFLGLLNEDDDQRNSEDLLQVNLIITDYCMPGMTGYDLLRKIKVNFIHSLINYLFHINSSFITYIFDHILNKKISLNFQKSASFKDIPVVIMSSENVPSRINR